MEKEAQAKNESGLTSALRTPRSQKVRQQRTHAFEASGTVGGKNESAGLFEEQPRDITFYLDLEIEGSEEVPKIVLEIAPDYLVSEGVINAIEKFNELFKSRGIQLPLDTTLYCPRLPKKNGRPKLDMPSLDYKQKLLATKVAAVSLQIKDKEAIHRAAPSEYEREKQPTTSTRIEADMTFEKKEVEIKPEERPQKKNVCFSSVC